MPQKAIIHVATRVIRAVTTDPNPTVGPGHGVVTLLLPVNLAGGPWKLDTDDQTLKTPTQAEIDASGADEERVAAEKQSTIRDFKTAVQTMLNDPLVPPTIKDTFTAFLKMFRG